VCPKLSLSLASSSDSRQWRSLAGDIELDHQLLRLCTRGAVACLSEEESEMANTEIGIRPTRRTFIKAAGATGVTAYVLWFSGPPWVPQLAVAADVTTLNSAQAREMLAMTRQLFPHDSLGDEFYWVAVESIDKDMAASPELAARMREGLANLNQILGREFTALNSDQQVEAMKKLEGTPFFADMLSKTQVYLYNNKSLWPKFGYGGSSWEAGGYINRGFNDVRWTDG